MALKAGQTTLRKVNGNCGDKKRQQATTKCRIIIVNETTFFRTGQTKVLLQLGLDVETIIGSAYPSFGFGGRNSAGLLLVNFGF
jgi:hypothetical protein